MFGANNFAVDATADAAAFTSTNLAQYKAVVWFSATDDVPQGRPCPAAPRLMVSQSPVQMFGGCLRAGTASRFHTLMVAIAMSRLPTPCSP